MTDKKKTSVVKFRGINTVESNIALYNKKLEESEAFIKDSCESEIAELRKAQEKFRDKLQKVMKSKEVKNLHEEILDAEESVSHSFNRLQRELYKMQDDIHESDLSSEKKQNKLIALDRAVAEQYNTMVEKYPAAMRAQMLSRISNVQLLL